MSSICQLPVPWPPVTSKGVQVESEMCSPSPAPVSMGRISVKKVSSVDYQMRTTYNTECDPQTVRTLRMSQKTGKPIRAGGTRELQGGGTWRMRGLF